MKLSIIIPTYNEARTVEEVIKRVKKLKLPVKKEIIVVDDGSNDGSFEIIRKFGGIKFIRHGKNSGKGAAVKTGIRHATGDYFIIQDADLELAPEEIINVIKPIINGKAEVVYGSRNLKFKKEDRALSFYLGGKFITFITDFLYGIRLTDEPCGFKCFKTEIVKELGIKNNGFEWEPEITAKITKKGIKIHEIPVSMHPRLIKEGKKLKRRDGIIALWILIKYRFKH